MPAEVETGVEKVLMVDELSEPLSQISGVGAGNPIHLHLDQDLLPVNEALTAAGIKQNLDSYIQQQPEKAQPCSNTLLSTVFSLLSCATRTPSSSESSTPRTALSRMALCSAW